MNILNITIVLNSGADHIMLHTDLKEGIWPYTGYAVLKTEAAYNKGEQWVKDNFPDVPCTIIPRLK
jgi:hypothetical protein